MVGSISGVNPYAGIYRYGSLGRAGAVGGSSGIQAVQGVGSVQAVRRAESLESPVEAVRPVSVVSANASSGIPFLRLGADPAEMAVRMRMSYGESAQSDGATNAASEYDMGVAGAQQAFEEGECKTCAERKYQDGSDDPGVSYQTPTHIAPEQAAVAVRGHEMEHVVRERSKAEREDRRVLSQTVTLHTAICPECGKSYISGGTTRTTTAANPQPAAERFETQAGQEARAPFSAVA